MHSFRIADHEAYDAWCKLVGCEIAGDIVKCTREFYLEHANEIYAIQLGSAFRRKD